MKVFTDSQVNEILAYANDLAKMVEAKKVPKEYIDEATNIVAGLRNMVSFAESFEFKAVNK